MATILEINPPRVCGYPKIIEISANKPKIKPDIKNPVFYQPIKVVNYSERKGGLLIFKV